MLGIIISVCTYMYNHLVSSLSSSIYSFRHLIYCTWLEVYSTTWFPLLALLMREISNLQNVSPHPSVSLIRSTRPCLNISISCPAVSPNEPLTFTEKSGQTAWSLIRHPSVLSAILPSICQFFSTSFHLSVNSSIFSSICQFFSTVLCSLSSICQ